VPCGEVRSNGKDIEALHSGTSTYSTVERHPTLWAQHGVMYNAFGADCVSKCFNHTPRLRTELWRHKAAVVAVDHALHGRTGNLMTSRRIY
jgi:hypothetical protein